MRAVIYARQVLDNPVDGETARQILRCKDWIASRNDQLVAVYNETDRDGTSSERTGFNTLLNSISDDKTQRVVMAHATVLASTKRVFDTLWGRLIDAGLEVVFITQANTSINQSSLDAEGPDELKRSNKGGFIH